jgi:hypothetical protein
LIINALENDRHGFPGFESIPVLDYLCRPSKGGKYQITKNQNPKFQTATGNDWHPGS